MITTYLMASDGSRRPPPPCRVRSSPERVVRRRSKSHIMNTLAHLSLKRRIPLQLGSEGSRKSDEDPMTEGAVYERIKNWLLAQSLVPGQLLQIGVLADELGVSTTPVREALTRLAAERMIMSVPKRGFFARTPSEDDIFGLYSRQPDDPRRGSRALAGRQSRSRPAATGGGCAVAVQERSAEQLARQTGELFLQVATALGGGRIRRDRPQHERPPPSRAGAGSARSSPTCSWRWRGSPSWSRRTSACSCARRSMAYHDERLKARRRHLQGAAAAAVHDRRLVALRSCGAVRRPAQWSRHRELTPPSSPGLDLRELRFIP